MRLYFVVAAAAAGGWAKPTDSDPRSANLHRVNSLFCTLYGPNSKDSRTGVSALAPFMSCISAWESPVLSDAVTIAPDDSRRIKLLDDITRIRRASSILITISERVGAKDQRGCIYFFLQTLRSTHVYSTMLCMTTHSHPICDCMSPATLHPPLFPCEFETLIGEVPSDKNQQNNAHPEGDVKVWNPRAHASTENQNAQQAQLTVKK